MTHYVFSACIWFFVGYWVKAAVTVWFLRNGVGPYRYDYICSETGCHFTVSCSSFEGREIVKKNHEARHVLMKGVVSVEVGPIERVRPCERYKAGAVCTAEGCFGETCIDPKSSKE